MIKQCNGKVCNPLRYLSDIAVIRVEGFADFRTQQLVSFELSEEEVYVCII